MNAPDPLEVELSELLPRPASRGFQRRVVDRLRDRPPIPRQSPMLAVACGLAAACVMAILLWWQSAPAEREQIVTQPGTESPIELGDMRPTVMAYRRVLAGSPEALDAVLEQHGESILPSDPAGQRFRAFRRSDVERFE